MPWVSSKRASGSIRWRNHNWSALHIKIKRSWEQCTGVVVMLGWNFVRQLTCFHLWLFDLSRFCRLLWKGLRDFVKQLFCISSFSFLKIPCRWRIRWGIVHEIDQGWYIAHCHFCFLLHLWLVVTILWWNKPGLVSSNLTVSHYLLVQYESYTFVYGL